MTGLPVPDLSRTPIALFLDVDGTLVEIEEKPEAVAVPAGLPATLERLLARQDGAVALVSGRPLAQIDALFAPLRFSAAGLHGFQRRNLVSGFAADATAPEGIDEMRSALERFAGSHPGVALEDKGATLALHYRQAPEAEPEAHALVERLVAESRDGMMLLSGKMVFELKPPGVDKGRAVDAFMGEPPFAGRLAVFCGDDVTDEAGFAAVNRRDGVTIRVGDDGRATEARFVLPDVSSLREWLGRIAA